MSGLWWAVSILVMVSVLVEWRLAGVIDMGALGAAAAFAAMARVEALEKRYKSETHL